MKIQEIVNPVACKCGSKEFAVSRIRLNSTGPYVDSIVCTNPSCNITYGQVEPSSITTNLAQINEVMIQVAKALDTFNEAITNRSSNVESNSDKTTVATKSDVVSNKTSPTATYQNGIQSNATKEVKPDEEDPLSSDPEADQSPE